MEKDITKFLIKYPNIDNFDDNILDPYKEDFYEVIYKKKEFYENRLENFEQIPKKLGSLMKHQKLISRFFSSNTLYDELLLLHEMGTGKSCSAVGAVEQIREEGTFMGALYLAKGDSLINNFTNELIFKCTDGRYIPNRYEEITELEKVHRKKKSIKDYYQTNTFATFAKEISKISNEKLVQWCERYNNYIIIIDEVHNLRMKAELEEEGGVKIGVNVYNEFWRFLHALKDCKILLMSGTPMKDGVDEIASIMNLIIPLDRQLPTGIDFTEKFFNKSEEILIIKPAKIPELKTIFKGRVSYLKAMQSQIKKIFAGHLSGKLKYFNVVEDKMSDFQTKYYEEAYEADRGEHKGVWSNSRQASLFVFPDGTWGSEGFKKYVVKTKVSSLGGSNKSKKTAYDYYLGEELTKKLKADSHDEMLDKLYVYSSKYAESIRNILQAQKQNKSVFVYNEFVTGSGLVLFGLILKLFGFSKASGNELEGSELPRYATLTSETSTTRQINLISERFNNDDNMYGKIINIIIGSRKISEGFSFKNVQVEEIQTPWFNYSETSQAIARGYRLGSHKALLQSGFIPELTIYQRVSIPNSDTSSIDLDMYKIAEDKDISIKGVERIMKESAWDCALTYRRNNVIGADGERDCDYLGCYYECDGIGVPEDVDDLDISTFHLKYNSANIEDIINKLVLLFRENFRLDLDSIILHFKEFSDFDVISALRILINESRQIINKYGFPSYLKEDMNIFFLVDSLSVIGSSMSDYYTEYPNIKKQISFEQIIEPIYTNSLPEIINQSSRAEVVEDIRKVMIRLPIEIQEYFIEGSIQGNVLASKTGKDNARLSKTRKLVLEYFKNKYDKFDGTVWISWLLNESEEPTFRCFDENDIDWKDCDAEYVEKGQKYKQNLQAALKDSPYGWYGLYNPKRSNFCIRNVKEKDITKLHKQTSGIVCKTVGKQELINIILDDFSEINIPSMDEINKIEAELKKKMPAKEANMTKMKKVFNDINGMNKNQVLADIKSNKYIDKRLDPSLPIKDLKRISFWGNQTIPTLCGYLHIWLSRTPYFIDDDTCGSSDKTKPKI
jgi:hypothetical protein